MRDSSLFLKIIIAIFAIITAVLAVASLYCAAQLHLLGSVAGFLAVVALDTFLAALAMLRRHLILATLILAVGSLVNALLTGVILPGDILLASILISIYPITFGLSWFSVTLYYCHEDRK